MIVLDTSVFVDALIPKVKAGHELAMDVLSVVDARGLAVLEPKVFLVELAGPKLPSGGRFTAPMMLTAALAEG